MEHSLTSLFEHFELLGAVGESSQQVASKQISEEFGSVGRVSSMDVY